VGFFIFLIILAGGRRIGHRPLSSYFCSPERRWYSTHHNQCVFILGKRID